MEAEDFVHEFEHYFGPPALINERKPVMATLTFTVAAMYDPSLNPKTGKTPLTGRIKTESGSYVSFWPSDKHLFTVGGSYKALCDEREWNGQTFYTVKSPGKGGAIEQQGGAQPAQQQAQAPLPSTPAFSPLSKDELILRQAVAKSCIESQQSQADADSWVAWILKEAPAAAPVDAGGAMPPAADLDDEIPF